MNGYMGRILRVNLTTDDVRAEPLNEAYARQFVGGSGLACRYLYDLIDANTDPLGPDNTLIFMTGPLVGTTAPSCGRFVVCARSPLTGIWGEANSGGSWGPALRFAGYDGLIITGQSERPVYLHIHDGAPDGEAELRDAAHLWGLDFYAAHDALKAELGDAHARARVAAIGPAGEKQVKMAAVLNDNARAAGRTGMGAVMGAKRLKAVVVGGRNKVPLADPVAFRAAAKEATAIVREDFASEMFRELGTAGWMDPGSQLYGDVPHRYFSQGEFGGAFNLSGSTMAETILTRNSSCYGCPIGCGRVVEIKEGPYTIAETDGPEYETICAFGTLLLVDDLGAVTALNRRCNELGMDTISAGVSIAFAYHLFDEGVLTESDTGGVALRWGDPAGAFHLLDLLARRAEGLGALLVEGVRAMGAHYGRPEDAAHVKGLEIPMHEPRAFSGMALAYATSPRGACHVQGDPYQVDIGMAVPELGLLEGDRFETKDKAQMVARSQDWRTLYNALIMCQFCNPPVENTVAMINGATGWGIGVDDLLPLGERIFQLKRMLNCRLGVTAADDRLPAIVLQPLEAGGTEGHVPDLEALLRDYYQVRGWDPATGCPTPTRLAALGLDDIS
jgi:aldehyde:ferredoxin oxidoreductase